MICPLRSWASRATQATMETAMAQGGQQGTTQQSSPTQRPTSLHPQPTRRSYAHRGEQSGEVANRGPATDPTVEACRHGSCTSWARTHQIFRLGITLESEVLDTTSTQASRGADHILWLTTADDPPFVLNDRSSGPDQDEFLGTPPRPPQQRRRLHPRATDNAEAENSGSQNQDTGPFPVW